MPDSNGRIPPVFFRSEAWLRTFGPITTNPDEVELDQDEPEFEVEFAPDWSLDD